MGSTHGLQSDPRSLSVLLLQVHGGTDTGQMAECLGSITHLFTRGRHFFRKHAKVVRIGQGVVEVRERELPDIGNRDVVSGSLYTESKSVLVN